MTKAVPIWYIIIVAVVGPTLGIILTFGYLVHASAGQRSATCAVIAANRAEKRAQLQQYQENPPTTELAKNLQSTYQDSLRTWDALWKTLGCEEAGDGV